MLTATVHGPESVHQENSWQSDSGQRAEKRSRGSLSENGPEEKVMGRDSTVGPVSVPRIPHYSSQQRGLRRPRPSPSGSGTHKSCIHGAPCRVAQMPTCPPPPPCTSLPSLEFPQHSVDSSLCFTSTIPPLRGFQKANSTAALNI